MTDKQLIKEEIKRRINNLWHLLPEGEKVLQDNFTKDDANNLGKYTALESLLRFIDSLPEESGCEANFTTKSEDLDFLVISLEETIGTSPHSREVIKEHLQKAAEWQKQQMMKDVVELHIIESFNPIGAEDKKPHGFTALCYNAEYPDFYPVTGQTIKVIPIKEIQQ